MQSSRSRRLYLCKFIPSTRRTDKNIAFAVVVVAVDDDESK